MNDQTPIKPSPKAAGNAPTAQDTQKSRVVTPHPSSLKRNRPSIARDVGRAGWMRTYRPLWISGGLSLIWIGLCIAGFLASERSLGRMPLYEIAGLLAGATLPLMVVWMITIAFLRLNPVREEQVALSHGLEALLSPLDIAQKRIEAIVADLHKQIGHVEAAGDIAATRIGTLESRFQEQISALFEATTGAEKKALGFQELLGREREAFGTLAADITVHIKELETLFSQMKFDSETITNLTRKNSETVSNEMVFQKKTLDERAGEIEERLNIMGDKLFQLTDNVSRQTARSEEKLGGLVQQLDEKQHGLAGCLTSLASGTDSICEKLQEQTQIIQELNDKSAADSEKLTALIREQAQDLSVVAAGALAQTAEAGESFTLRAREMERVFTEVGTRSRSEIDQVTDGLTLKTEMIRQMIGDFTQNLDRLVEETSRKLATQSESLEHSLSARISGAQDALEDQAEMIREGLKRQGEEIGRILGENTDALTDRMAETLTRLEEHSGRVRDSVSENAAQLDQTLDHMAHHTGQFEELSGRFRTQMTASEQELQGQHEKLAQNIAQVTDGLEQALGKLKDQSGDLGSHGQQVVDSLIAQTDQLAARMEEIRHRTDATLRDIEAAEDRLGDHVSAAEDKTGRLAEDWRKTAEYIGMTSVETIGQLNGLMERMKSLEEENSSAAATAETRVNRISDELLHASESIYLASASAIEAADETNRVLDQHNQKFQQLINAIQMSSRSIITDAENIEKRLEKRTSGGFAPLASRVMEQLQSAAIDIGRYLEDEDSDELWKLYVNGDKNAFLRRLKKTADKKTVSRIADKCNMDPDFRHAVQNYMEAFEDLMSRAMSSNANTAFSVALISSDAGKVYLALAQAMGRLS